MTGIAINSICNIAEVTGVSPATGTSGVDPAIYVNTDTSEIGYLLPDGTYQICPCGATVSQAGAPSPLTTYIGDIIIDDSTNTPYFWNETAGTYFTIDEATNLDVINKTQTSLEIESNTGTNATLNAATPSTAGIGGEAGLLSAQGAEALEPIPSGDINCAATNSVNKVTLSDVDAYVDLGIEFSNAAIAGHTNTCNRVVTASSNSSATGTNTFTSSSNGSDSNANFSSNIGTVNSTTTATYTLNAAGGQLITDSSYSFNTGRSNTINGGGGAYNAAFGRGNTMVAGTQRSVVTGAVNSVSGDAHFIGGGVANSITAAQNVALLGGRRTIAPDSDTIVGGYNAGGGSLSSNRTFQVNLNGGNVDIAGVYTSSVVFPDVAEMFDNAKKGEIEVGTPVTIKDGGVAVASNGDYIIGVVSGAYAALYGDSDVSGESQFQLDKFGKRIEGEIKEEDTDKKVKGYLRNPNFDASKVGTRKSQDKENYSAVALVGQPPAKVSKDVKSGDFLQAENGVLVKSNERTNLIAYKELESFNKKDGYAIYQVVVK